MKILKLLAFVLITFNLCAQSNDELLIKACLQGDLAAVKKAVEAGANPNAVGATGGRPLPSSWFWPEITQYLIDKGANPNDGNSPALVMASRYYSIDVMKILLKAGADPNKPLIVNTDPSAAIKKLLEDEKAKGKKANKIVIKTYEDMIEKAGGGNAQAQGTTPLQMVVAFTNCKECAELLLNAGAKTDIGDANNRNMLHTLAFSWIGNAQRVEMIQKNTPYMEQAGAKVPGWYHNLDPSKYGTAGDMIALLKNKGVDILKLDKLEMSPLQLALSRDEKVPSEVLLGFINNGANVNEDVKRRGSIVVQAAAYGSPEVMAALIAKGVDINHEDAVSDGEENWKGYTALINATKTDNLPTVKYLVENGAKVTNGVNGTGTIYSFKKNTKCTGYKVKNKSVIFFAIETGDMELVKYLIEAKNLSWKNIEPMEYEEPKGMTHNAEGCFPFGVFAPPAYAKKIGNEEMQKYLKDADLGLGFFKK